MNKYSFGAIVNIAIFFIKVNMLFAGNNNDFGVA